MMCAAFHNAKGTALSKVYPKNLNANPHHFVMKMPDTTSQSKEYAKQNTIYAILIPNTPSQYEHKIPPNTNYSPMLIYMLFC